MNAPITKAEVRVTLDRRTAHPHPAPPAPHPSLLDLSPAELRKLADTYADPEHRNAIYDIAACLERGNRGRAFVLASGLED